MHPASPDTFLADLRDLLKVPDSHAILFTQGGGTTQFSSVVMNLLPYYRQQQASTSYEDYKPPVLDYVVTGSWSSKAYAEAQRLAEPTSPQAKPYAAVHLAVSMKQNKFTKLPREEEYKFSEDASMVYYCENETINGIQFPLDSTSPTAFPFDKVPKSAILVADYSSSFLSRPIPRIEQHGIIYAGAQKNLGPSGVTVVIVRKDLLVDTTAAAKLGGVPTVPIALEFKTLADNESMYNTPPTFPIYVSALVLKHLIKDKGGINGLEETNRKKAELLYSTLDAAASKGVARAVVQDQGARSWMNVTFQIEGEGAEKKFLVGAEQKGFQQLKGHRSVGGGSAPKPRETMNTC
jgi:phosphoserine aminotransferase